MITGKEDLLQALIEAFLMEKGTNIFYSEAAAKAENPVARKTFQELSVWEEKHMDYIHHLYAAIQGDLDVEGFGTFQSRAAAPLTEGGIPVKDLEARIESYTFSGDSGAYDVAMGIEAKAYSLYRRLSEGAGDANARVVFSEMMDQEQKHIDYLKKTRGEIA